MSSLNRNVQIFFLMVWLGSFFEVAVWFDFGGCVIVSVSESEIDDDLFVVN